MEIQLLRHATLIITAAGKKMLVDPMFSPAGANPTISNTPNQRRNPLVDLPLDDRALKALITTIDAVIVTHTHGDHWDVPAQKLLPKTLPIFCQPEDLEKIRGAGFHAAQAVEENLTWGAIKLSRTGGQHGRGEIGKLMAPVSGFILQAVGEPLLYIAGDTIWCTEVEEVVKQFAPEVIVVNAGAAQFNEGGAITMTADDVIKAAQTAAEATVFAVHMESINHCMLSRAALYKAIDTADVANRVYIPEDGGRLLFPKKS
jgi:L-ascorbate metabolism protein UlaG (beta-lactamase superfamily)